MAGMMSIEDCQQVIANLCLSHKKFRPLGEPTLTTHGGRIEFMQCDVSMAQVAVWFTNAGVTVTLCGVENCYAEVPTWICEYRLPR